MDDSREDIYHRCIDIKLVKGAPKDAPGTATDPVMNDGIECAKEAANAQVLSVRQAPVAPSARRAAQVVATHQRRRRHPTTAEAAPCPPRLAPVASGHSWRLVL